MNNKKVVSAVIISIILIVLVLLSIRQHKSQKPVLTPEITLVYAENQVEDYPTTKGAYEFARLVNEKTNGRIKIIVKCNGELGDEKSVIEQLKFGGIDFSRVSVASISDDIPELKVIQMPFLYSDAQDMWDVLNGDEGLQFITAIDESNLGIKTLSWYDAGARSFYSVKPVMNIQDLSGLNIRVQESELMSEIIEMLEIHPVKMIYSEVYKGLQTGKIDGAENSLVTYIYSKHYEQAKYYNKKLILLTHIGMAITIFIVFITLPFILKVYNLSEAASEATRHIIWFHGCCAILIWAESFTLPATFRACGDAKACMIISTVSMWIFRVGASYILGKNLGLGVFGVWVAMIIDWAFRSLLFGIRYFSGKWKKHALVS